MAMKLSFSKMENQKGILSRLPRFNLDLRINNMKIELLYTPVMETLVRVWKEKKGIVEIAAKQFNEFEKTSSKKSKQIKKKATK
jgi:hypothetical protein